jgi:hypothetical protein
MSAPRLGLCVDGAQADSLARVITAASYGAEPQILTGASSVGPSMVLVIDAAEARRHLAELARAGVQLIVVADEIEPAWLGAAAEVPGIVGIVGRSQGRVRTWELAYLVRRIVAPRAPIPGSHELLGWGSSTVVFRPTTTGDLGHAVQAVEAVSTRFGVARRVAAMAAEASHELLMNAMYDAPHDRRGRPRYAGDRQASITLDEQEIPLLRVTIDSDWLALDAVDPFGRLTRDVFLGSLVNAQTSCASGAVGSAVTAGPGGARLGLYKLFASCTSLRAEVDPGQRTLVSWVVDRTGEAPPPLRSTGRSLAFLTSGGASA